MIIHGGMRYNAFSFIFLIRSTLLIKFARQVKAFLSSALKIEQKVNKLTSQFPKYVFLTSEYAAHSKSTWYSSSIAIILDSPHNLHSLSSFW